MATGNIPGTNIPKSAVANNRLGDWTYWEARIRGAENPNDVLFDLAYNTPFTGSAKTGSDFQGQGQGNPSVGNIQAGRWKLVGDVDTVDHKAGTSWAEEHINSSNDVYIQDDGNVISMDPNTGSVLVNQKDATGNLGAAPVGAVISGDRSKIDASRLSWLLGDTTTTTAGGAANLLDYRPWTQSYWDKYLGSDIKKSLFSMKSPPVEQGLAYLPGEFRDPKGWQNFMSSGFKGHVPEGAWRTAPGNYNIDPGRQVVGGRTEVPWNFTSPAYSTNIAYTPGFTGADISPTAATEWGGLLGSMPKTITKLL